MDVSMTQSTITSEPGASTGDVSTLARRSDPRSPMSLGNLGASTLSMRAKAARKRQANAQHNSNFRAGYVPVQEEVLHKTGIRGRKRYLLYCTLSILTIFALLNIAVTVWLMYILGMTHLGMTNVEITSQAGRDFVRFLASSSIITLTTRGAPLGARYDSNLTLEAEGGKLNLRTKRKVGSPPSVVLDGGNITMTTDEFCVGDRRGWDWASLSDIGYSDAIVNFRVKAMEVTKVTGVKHVRDLYLESIDRSVVVQGYEGVQVSTQKDINMKTAGIEIDSNSLTFGTKRGLLATNLPKVIGSKPFQAKLSTFKLCVCSNGKLFKVKAALPGATCDVGTQALQKICHQGKP